MLQTGLAEILYTFCETEYNRCRAEIVYHNDKLYFIGGKNLEVGEETIRESFIFHGTETDEMSIFHLNDAIRPRFLPNCGSLMKFEKCDFHGLVYNDRIYVVSI